MAAKPIIDILCIVQCATRVADYNQAMIALGYEARGECLDASIPGTPGRFYFPMVVEGQHVLHVHVCQEGHPQVKDLLALRDYLRTHPQRALAYGQLKVRLAQTVSHDNVAYMRGKDKMVKELISEALQWTAQQADAPEPLTRPGDP